MAYFETLSRIVPEATSGQDEAIREIRCGYATERERVLTDVTTSWEQKMYALRRIHAEFHRRLDEREQSKGAR
jgi:hypothetical protein